MQGYYISSGYCGLVSGNWMLFATEAEYYDYVEELFE